MPRDYKAPRRKPNPPPAVSLVQGRPPTYKPEFDELTYRLALLKLTDEEQAAFFGIAPQTMYLWDVQYPSFKEARDNGKERTDAAVVASLVQSALGYSHQAEKVMVIDGNINIVRYTERFPPNVKAAELLLSNRQPQRWRMKSRDEDATQHSVEIVIKGGLPE